MLGLPVFQAVGADDPRNGAVNLFMETLAANSGVVELDSRDPADVAAANGGVRADNINLLNDACSELIVVQCPSEDDMTGDDMTGDDMTGDDMTGEDLSLIHI